LSHKVRTHTRTVKGRTVTVRQHSAADPAAEQKKRHAFERRVNRERQQAEAQALRDRQDAEALYPKTGTRTSRTPGERKRRKRGPKPARAKRHAKKALRLWRRHKVKAVLFAGLAAGEMAAFGVVTGAGRVRSVIRRMRKTRSKGKKKP
jgi:hypothetical protein